MECFFKQTFLTFEMGTVQTLSRKNRRKDIQQETFT